MYNLFVSGHEGAWEKGRYVLDKSRFCEYTNIDVASRFSVFDEEQVKSLMSFPCLFVYEGSFYDVRIGYLKQVNVIDKDIVIEFELVDSIKPIPFSLIAPIAGNLDFRRWEMNRTHWAVKDEDLVELLYVAQILTTENYKLLKMRSGNILPSAISDNSISINSVQDFIKEVLGNSVNSLSEIFYRGHSNRKKYKLEPSLFRRDDDGNYLHLNEEHVLYRELLVANSADFSPDDYTLDKLVRMQHFSLPTRLLDITSNPLIALYFACISGSAKKDQDEVEGEVISFEVKREEIKYFDSDTASCLANLARLPLSEKESIDFNLKEIDAFNRQESVSRLIHFIREEKSFFEPRIKSKHLNSILCVKGKRSNERISSQSGSFLLFGLDAVLSEEGTEDITVRRIVVKNKRRLLEELDILNINESTVFPNIENSAKYIKQKFSFKTKIEVQTQ